MDRGRPDGCAGCGNGVTPFKVVEENYQVVQPALDLQQAIRRKILGVKYWEKMTRHRKKMFSSYDQVKLQWAHHVDNRKKNAI